MIMADPIIGKGTSGVVEGEAIVTKHAFSFYADVSSTDGTFITAKHGQQGSIAGKILIVPAPSGGMGSAWRVAEMKRNGVAPLALVMRSGNPVMTHACVFAQTPMLSDLDADPIELVETGDLVRVDADRGELHILRKAS